MLACDTESPPGYVLYIDSHEDGERLGQAAEIVDTRLRENFHYNYARRLGQLACVRAFRARDGAAAYADQAMRNGQNPGDVKIPAVDRRRGWSEIFESARPLQ